MHGIFIGSSAPRAGKSLLSYSLGLMLQRSGYSVGYMKPLGMHPQKVEELQGDADALVLQEVLGQHADADVLTPVMLPKTLHELSLYTHADPSLCMHRIRVAYDRLAVGRDFMLVAGTAAFPAAGTFCGADGKSIVSALGLKVLLMERFHHSINYDALLSLKNYLGDSLLGVVLNDLPEEEMRAARTILSPYLEARGIPVFGVIPREPGLSAMRVADLAVGLSGRIVAGNSQASRMVHGFLIGTMQVENFMSRLRVSQGSAIIVGGDRTDLHLAALHGNCTCLVLTGNMRPSELVRAKAEELAVPVITVKEDTYEVASSMARILHSKKLRDLAQIRLGAKVIAGALDYEKLLAMLNGCGQSGASA